MKLSLLKSILVAGLLSVTSLVTAQDYKVTPERILEAFIAQAENPPLAASDDKALATQTVTHWSTSFNQWWTYRYIIPVRAEGERLPVLYMLNQATGNSNSYPSGTNIRTVAENYRMIVVFPDGGAYGWYLDSPITANYRFETYMTQELIAHVDANLPTIPQRNARAAMGFSMGGHGAMIMSSRNPNLYISASSTGGIMDIRNHPFKWQIANRLGARNSFPDRWNTYSNVAQANALSTSGVRRLFDCGLSDNNFTGVGALEDNRLLRDTLLSIQHPFIYREFPGGHNFTYVNARIPQHLNFHQAAMIDSYENPELLFWYYFKRLQEITIENAQLRVSPPSQPVLMFLGDAAADWIPAELFANVYVTKRGIGGDTLGIGTRGITKRLIESVNDINPDVIVIEAGRYDLLGGIINGWNPSFNRMVQEYGAMLDSVRAAKPNAQIIVTSCFPVGGAYGGMLMEVLSFNNQIKQLCQARGITYLDVHSAILGPQGYVDGNYTQDGFHLNYAGYKVWAQMIQQATGIESSIAAQGANFLDY